MDPLIIKNNTTIEEILEYAMNEDEHAAGFYLKASKKAFDPDVKSFLIALATMEEMHYHELKNKLEEVRASRFSVQGILDSFESGH